MAQQSSAAPSAAGRRRLLVGFILLPMMNKWFATGNTEPAVAMTGLWAWVTLAGLGMFHGLNPAMGWLFAVALGMHRHSRETVLIALVAAAVLILGAAIDVSAIRIGTGFVLIVWAMYHWLYGHRHRVRIGMTAGFAGLLLWSFLMATAHGAGLMLVPALIPLCMGRPSIDQGSAWTAVAAVGVHTLATLLVTGSIAVI